MDIAHTGVLGKADKAADLQVLTDGHDLFGHGLGHGQLSAGILAVHQGIHVGGIVVGHHLGDVLDEGHEGSALGAEVGLAVDLHQCAHAVLHQSVRHALGGDAAGLLGGLGQALLTQILHGLVHIAVGLGQCLLAVHHTHASHLTQVLNISSSKSHFLFLQFVFSKVNGAGQRPCPVG